MKLLYVVNEAQFFLSHRLPLAIEARKRGYEVIVVSAPGTGEEGIFDEGFQHLPVPLSRSGFSLKTELATYRGLRAIYRSVQPDLVHHVTIKPVLYGSLAARSANVGSVVNAVPGMGYVFTRRGSRASVARAFVNFLYRIALNHSNMRVIFQNSEDLAGFVGHAIVRHDQTVLIRGAGVDLDVYANSPEPEGPPVFLLVSRMIKDKGVWDFAQAAGVIKKQYPDWRFLLAGGLDEEYPAALSEQQLRQMEQDYGVEWLGHREDIPELLKICHVFCLPSYREGLPKALIEAAAAGRALIASDIAGCREVVTQEVTGLLVETRSPDAMKVAMLRLGEDSALRQRLAKAAYEKAVAVFGQDDVVKHTFRVYDELLAGSNT